MLHIFKRSIASRISAARPFTTKSTFPFKSTSPSFIDMAPKRKRAAPKAETNPQVNPEIIDAPDALRASPDSDVDKRIAPGPVKDEARSESPLSDIPEVAVEPPPKKKRNAAAAAKPSAKRATAATNDGETAPKATPAKKTPVKAETGEMGDPEAEGDEEEAGEEEILEASTRPPPVNSDYLPLPWKGRLGYACLNTYLRYSTPPVFSSRTCRIASILEHRHPLKDPSQPEHATKNRPDREQPADIKLGQRYVEEICLANVRDVVKMIRWNEKYGIRFLRLSSEMFPFASHEEYGYKLAPFAADELAAAGKVIAELGHRVTTHPGQFTQLGSPRKSVIDNAVRDLAYHDEMLSLLKLPEQMDKDAVMILHLGGVFGDKEATLNRFRENYSALPQSVKNRLVLENDDVSWNVHELLPVCEELNIPMVLDFHHHNIIFDANELREGTADIVNVFPRIKATWDRKGIKQKMHYSEPTPAAITGRQRRKHNPRVATLPPCAPDMDLMIEAKDKEQAVFELMRTFKLPGYDTFGEIIPHVRPDDNKAALSAAARKKPTPKKIKGKKEEDDEEPEDDAAAAAAASPTLVPDAEVGMGGPDGRVYWPPTMEHYLRPKKREVKKKAPAAAGPITPAQKKKEKAAAAAAAAEAAALQAASTEDVMKDSNILDSESDSGATPATKKAKAAIRAKANTQRAKATALANGTAATAVTKAAAKKPVAAAAAAAPKKRAPKVKKEEKEERAASTPLSSEVEEDEEDEESAPTLESDGDEPATPLPARPSARGARKSNRATSKAKVNYQDADVSMDEA